jgi:hypothetical protein
MLTSALRDAIGLPATAGIELPSGFDAFSVALACHIAAGLTAVLAGAVAATAPKRPGRHPRFGVIYLWAIGGVFATALVMAMLRWPHDTHLVVIGSIAFTAAMLGYLARRRHRRGWRRWHILAMAVSYVALFTGFYVDNGPKLPLWDRLPPVSFWFLPTIVGLPIVLRALNRHRRAQADL